MEANSEIIQLNLGVINFDNLISIDIFRIDLCVWHLKVSLNMHWQNESSHISD